MRNNLLEAIIGAVVLVVAGFFLFYAYSSGQKNIQGYVILAKFDRIDGLNSGADVKISGVKVGIVQSLEIDSDTYQATIAMTVKEGIKIPTDSSAEIASESLLGGKYVAIIPGGSDQFLSPNGMINRTQSSISFEGLISKFLFSKSEEPKKEQK